MNPKQAYFREGWTEPTIILELNITQQHYCHVNTQSLRIEYLNFLNESRFVQISTTILTRFLCDKTLKGTVFMVNQALFVKATQKPFQQGINTFQQGIKPLSTRHQDT